MSEGHWRARRHIDGHLDVRLARLAVESSRRGESGFTAGNNHQFLAARTSATADLFSSE
jgi:hypothetical protein